MRRHSLAVIASGCLWGLMGLFRRLLSPYGIDSAGMIIVRCFIAAAAFAVVMLIKDPGEFLVKPRDMWCFFGCGVVSLLFFTYCYYQAMALMSLSAAAILLYTAPAVVMLLSLFIFKERLTAKKLAALALSFAGCVLVSGLGGGGLTLMGVLYGLGAGVGYALYSIFARLALDRGYSSRTVNLYSCLLAALGASIIWGAGPSFSAMTSSWSALALCLAAALVTGFLPYLLYTYGLSGMEAGRASVMASVEPVSATLVGALVFHEAFTLRSAIGMALVLAAIVLLNARSKAANAENAAQ